jgi:ABC-type uncharacterized transport system substrate-binding protein
MKLSNTVLIAALSFVVLVAAGACAKKEQGPIDSAVENTKDALDIRDHEKLKDAAEGAEEAIKDAGEGVKDAAKEAAADVKQAAKTGQ